MRLNLIFTALVVGLTFLSPTVSRAQCPGPTEVFIDNQADCDIYVYIYLTDNGLCFLNGSTGWHGFSANSTGCISIPAGYDPGSYLVYCNGAYGSVHPTYCSTKQTDDLGGCAPQDLNIHWVNTYHIEIAE